MSTSTNSARAELLHPYHYLVPEGDFSYGRLFAYPEDRLPRPGADTLRGKSVCILGGGIAGLTAAYELVTRTSAKVTLLESEDTLGGRVRTHRFDRDTYGELGAMRIPAQHHGVR